MAEGFWLCGRILFEAVYEIGPQIGNSDIWYTGQVALHTIWLRIEFSIDTDRRVGYSFE